MLPADSRAPDHALAEQCGISSDGDSAANNRIAATDTICHELTRTVRSDIPAYHQGEGLCVFCLFKSVS